MRPERSDKTSSREAAERNPAGADDEMNVTFGCSHTQGTPEGGCWTDIMKSRYGTEVLNYGQAATGFFHTVETARQVARQAKAEGKTITRVILQKPMLNRYPWYCAPEAFSVKKAREAFNSLPDIAKKPLADRIFKIESGFMKDLVSFFPDAKFAYWHYWYDYHSFAPRVLVPYLDAAEALAESYGMQVWGTIVDGTPIVERALAEGGKLGSRGFVQSLVDQGWVLSVYDGHATRKHNELVANKAKEWIDALDDQNPVQDTRGHRAVAALREEGEPGHQ